MRNEANAAVWHSFKEGNWEAYTILYNNYYSLLNNYGYKFTHNSNLIEDAIHDLFVRLWTSRNNLGDPVSVKNYLLKSLRHTLLRKIKSEGKYTAAAAAEYPFGFEVTFSKETGTMLEEKEFRQKVKAVVNALPPRQKEIIYLRFYEEFPYDEIADIMNISIGSAYKLLYKALESLQQAFDPSTLLGMLGLLYFL